MVHKMSYICTLSDPYVRALCRKHMAGSDAYALEEILVMVSTKVCRCARNRRNIFQFCIDI